MLLVRITREDDLLRLAVAVDFDVPHLHCKVAGAVRAALVADANRLAVELERVAVVVAGHRHRLAGGAGVVGQRCCGDAGAREGEQRIGG